MTIDEHIAYWLGSADDNLKAAEDNLTIGHFDWCLFIGHLVLEKALKALFVKTNENKIPPKIHNLLRLADLSNLILTEEQSQFFSLVNKFQMEGRYPEAKSEFYKMATKEFTNTNFQILKENYHWLKSQII